MSWQGSQKQISSAGLDAWCIVGIDESIRVSIIGGEERLLLLRMSMSGWCDASTNYQNRLLISLLVGFLVRLRREYLPSLMITHCYHTWVTVQMIRYLPYQLQCWNCRERARFRPFDAAKHHKETARILGFWQLAKLSQEGLPPDIQRTQSVVSWDFTNS